MEDIVAAANAGDGARALEIAAGLAEGGDTTAMLYAGVIYRGGLAGVERDLPEAVSWFLRAADAGNPVGYWNAGLASLARTRDATLSREELRDAAQAGIAHLEAGHAAEEENASAELARQLIYGTATGRDPERAVAIFREAAARGGLRAMVDLGLLHIEGDLVDRDFAEAERLLSAVIDRLPEGNALRLEAIRYRGTLQRHQSQGTSISQPHAFLARQVFVIGRQHADELATCYEGEVPGNPVFRTVAPGRVDYAQNATHRRKAGYTPPRLRTNVEGVQSYRFSREVIFSIAVTGEDAALAAVDLDSVRTIAPEGNGVVPIPEIPVGPLTLSYGENGPFVPLTAEDTARLFSMPDGTPASHVRIDAGLCVSDACMAGVTEILARMEAGLKTVDADAEASKLEVLAFGDPEAGAPYATVFLARGWDLLQATARAAVASGLEGGPIKECARVRGRIEELRAYSR
ncbi:MAG: tetratricopeptide repeat protein [Pseudomonadota bacterium]